MCKKQIIPFLASLLLEIVLGVDGLAQSPQSGPGGQRETPTLVAQATSLVERNELERAEDRVEALCAKLFDLEITESNFLARLDDLDYRCSPEGIQRALAFVGSARPMDELREGLRIRLETQKARVKKQLEMLEATRERLEAAIRDAEADLERVRQR